MSIDTDAGLATLLSRDRTIAVVGLSGTWHRPSNFVAKYLQSQGYRVVPVNPRNAGEKILGETVYPSLDDIPFPIDMVDVFRKSEDVPPIAEASIRIGAKTLWQQIGVVNEAADVLVSEAGLDSVMNRCTKIEHARLFGGLHWVGVNTGVLSGARRGTR